MSATDITIAVVDCIQAAAFSLVAAIHLAEYFQSKKEKASLATRDKETSRN
jgi:hypothetical protein